MIRVVRILEYEFDTPELADRNMSKWGIPPTGSKVFGTAQHGYMTIRSAVIVDLAPKVEEQSPFSLFNQGRLETD